MDTVPARLLGAHGSIGILVRTPIQSMSMSGSAAETCSARNVSKSAGISVAVIGTETPLPKLGT